MRENGCGIVIPRPTSNEYVKRMQRLKEAEEDEEDSENEAERGRSETRDNGSNAQTSSRNATI
jgi:hypothetical protein